VQQLGQPPDVGFIQRDECLFSLTDGCAGERTMEQPLEKDSAAQ